MFPLQSVLLPGETLPLRIFEPRYVAMVKDVLVSADKTFGVVLIARGREVGGGDARNDIGTAARVVDCESTGTDRYALRAVGSHRIRVREWLTDDPYPRADTEPYPGAPDEHVVPLDALPGVQGRVDSLVRRIAHARRIELPRRWSIADGLPRDPGERLYALASRTPIGQADRYAVLAAPTLGGRIDALHEAIDTANAMLDFEASDR